MTFVQNPAESSYGSYNRIALFEGASVKYNPAPLMKRIISYSVDMAIIMAVLYVFYIVFFVLIFSGAAIYSKLFYYRGGDFMLFVILGLFLLSFLLIYDGYFIYFEYKKGFTLGKKLFGLRVVALNKPRLTLSQCVLRDLFRIIDCLLIVPGLLSIALTKKHQRLGDLVAGTWVVYSRRKEAEGSFIYVTPEQYHLYFEALRPAVVPEDESQSFLAFSHSEFISKRGRTWTPGEYQEWENFVLHYVPQAKARGLDRNSLFLFFAEYCLQTVNLRKKPPQPEVKL